MTNRQPVLSVVIPALNEAANLPFLLQDLSWQKNIHIEVIIVDGGSTDPTVTLCQEFATTSPFKITVIESKPGRAIQLNSGAASSTADELLFLHADSRIRKGTLLTDAQKFLHRKREQKNNQRLCGHFPLSFSSSPGNVKSYYFYECKTHLNKPDCVNGDQGFWIRKQYFEELGKFDESLPYMEDARLAIKIAADDNWITLPGEIETSARRFETEGFAKRQLLNTFLCNFNAMGESAYFDLTSEIYKQQDQATRLQLRPFLKLTHQYMFGDGIKTAAKRWYLTGTYIAKNAWQLAFALDCIKNRKQGLSPNADNASILEFYDRHLARAASWPLFRALTGTVAIAWFYSLFLIK